VHRLSRQSKIWSMMTRMRTMTQSEALGLFWVNGPILGRPLWVAGPILTPRYGGAPVGAVWAMTIRSL
jgi:hypothetical protein